MKQLSLHESQQVSGGLLMTGIGSAIGTLAGASIGLGSMYNKGTLSPGYAAMTVCFMFMGKALGNAAEFAYRIYSFVDPDNIDMDFELDIESYDWDSVGR